MKKAAIIFYFSVLLVLNGAVAQSSTHAMAKASRENKNGWIYVHLEGSPTDIGYQHGYLLANDIDTGIQAMAWLFKHDTKRDWQFYRNAAKSFLWDKLDREYKDEINGIVEGLRAKNIYYDSLDLT